MSRQRNRNPLKQYFLTIPQTQLSPEELYKLIEDKATTYFACSQETHEDGGKHLHAIIILEKAISFSNYLKYVQSKYPSHSKCIDLEVLRSVTNALEYISKETEPYTEGQIPKRKHKLRSIAQLQKYFEKNPSEYRRLIFDKPDILSDKDI